MFENVLNIPLKTTLFPVIEIKGLYMTYFTAYNEKVSTVWKSCEVEFEYLNL